MKLAFQLALANGQAHQFNTEKESAGQHWFKNFMSRHPNLSLRQSEATSLARARGFNRRDVNIFYEKLKSVIDQYDFDALSVYNMDESGIQTVQNPGRVIGKRGKKQIGSVTSGERGVTTTVVCRNSAAGVYIAPMIIFKRKRLDPHLNNDNNNDGLL
jgi:pantoate kinase